MIYFYVHLDQSNHFHSFQFFLLLFFIQKIFIISMNLIKNKNEFFYPNKMNVEIENRRDKYLKLVQFFQYHYLLNQTFSNLQLKIQILMII